MGTAPFILVVEDDLDSSTGLIEILRCAGYEAAGAANGAVALQKLRGDGPRPDLILLDLNMPVLSGWEFLALREADPRLLLIPVIILSGESAPAPGIERVGFLSKPATPDRILSLIESVLEERNPDPSRLPRPSEPWTTDASHARVIRNSFGHVVAYVGSEREARRIVAAVNGASSLSTEALEDGIIDRGLECLYQLDCYDTDPEYRSRIDGDSSIETLLSRRAELAGHLRGSPLGGKRIAPKN